MTALRILIVDDHPIVRQGIESLVSLEPDMVVAGCAATGSDFLMLHASISPDLTILDVVLPDMDGIEALILARRQRARSKFLMLTASHHEQDVIRAVKAGANGYVLKSAASTVLIGAVRSICAGKRFFSADIATDAYGREIVNDLTAREIQVLKRIAAGDENAAIALALEIDIGTVKNHVHHILAKLEAKTRTHAVAVALQRGLIRVPSW